MTDTGGFAFFFAWALFLALCLGLAYLILRARIPTVARGSAAKARADSGTTARRVTADSSVAYCDGAPIGAAPSARATATRFAAMALPVLAATSCPRSSSR